MLGCVGWGIVSASLVIIIIIITVFPSVGRETPITNTLQSDDALYSVVCTCDLRSTGYSYPDICQTPCVVLCSRKPCVIIHRDHHHSVNLLVDVSYCSPNTPVLHIAVTVSSYCSPVFSFFLQICIILHF